MPFRDDEARREYNREQMRLRRAQGKAPEQAKTSATQPTDRGEPLRTQVPGQAVTPHQSPPAGGQRNVAPAKPSPSVSRQVPPAPKPTKSTTHEGRWVSCETGFGQFTTIESVAKALNMAINRTSKPWATFYFHDLDKAEHQTWNLYRNESAMSLPDHPPGSLNIYLDLDWNEGDIRNLLANFVSRRGVQTYEALLEEIKQEKELTLGT